MKRWFCSSKKLSFFVCQKSQLRLFGMLAVFLVILAGCAQKQTIITTQKQVPLSEVKGATIETCNKAIDATSFVACIETLAVQQNDPDICDEITNKFNPQYYIHDNTAAYHRDVCILALVDSSKNKDFCKKISDSDLKFSCLNNLS